MVGEAGVHVVHSSPWCCDLCDVPVLTGKTASCSIGNCHLTLQISSLWHSFFLCVKKGKKRLFLPYISVSHLV